jgi:hypothetical protein
MTDVRTPPGWYPDPWGTGARRYWDGATWTGFVEDIALPQWGAPAPPVFVPADGPRRRFPLIGFLAIVVVVAFAGGVLVAVVRTHRTTHAAASNVSTDQALVNGLGVQPGDVVAGETVSQVPNGDDPSNEPTLDLCNATYPSESQRVARHQVSVQDSSGNGAFSTEAVLYESPGGTAQGFTELKQAALHCPKTPVPSPVNEQTVTTVFAAAPDSAWPQTAGVERLAYDFTSTDAQSNTSHSVAVYLRRGRVLEGIYFSLPGSDLSLGGLMVAGKTAMADIVTVFAQRMAALKPSVVNKTEGRSV